MIRGRDAFLIFRLFQFWRGFDDSAEKREARSFYIGSAKITTKAGAPPRDDRVQYLWKERTCILRQLVGHLARKL